MNNIIRSITVLTLLLHAVTGMSQQIHRVSLQGAYIKDRLPITFAEVIDAREVNSIGMVKLGFNGKPDVAVFEKPGAQEIEDMLGVSGYYQKADSGFVMRVRHLLITDITNSSGATARIELSLDIFLKSKADYYYAYSTNSTIQLGTLRMKDLHQHLIVEAFRDCLLKASRQSRQIESQPASIEDVRDKTTDFLLVSHSPLLNDEKLQDGFYLSFEEMINNAPSASLRCEVNIDENTLLRCDGGKPQQVNLYGFCQDGAIYVLYHKNFYPLTRDGDDFYFMGPPYRDFKTRKILNGWLIAGAWGVAMAVGTTPIYETAYKLETATGGIHAVTKYHY